MLGIIGIFVFFVLFRFSFALLGILILGGGVFFLAYAIYTMYQTAVQRHKESQYDEKGRRIAKTTILEMKDSEEKNG